MNRVILEPPTCARKWAILLDNQESLAATEDLKVLTRTVKVVLGRDSTARLAHRRDHRPVRRAVSFGRGICRVE
jgi:hypothetical protein